MEISHLSFELYRLRSHLKTAENGKYGKDREKNVFPFHPKQIELRRFFKNQSPYPPASTPPDESITLTNLPLQTPIYSSGGGETKTDATLLKEG